MDRIDRRLDAVTKLLHTGMKMLVKQHEENREFREDTQRSIKALIDAQMRTDAKLDRLEAAQRRSDGKLEKLIDALGRNRGNGHRH